MPGPRSSTWMTARITSYNVCYTKLLRFDYLAPARLDTSTLQPGVRVRIPFGRRSVIGLLLETCSYNFV